MIAIKKKKVQRDYRSKHQIRQHPVKWFLIYIFFSLSFPSEMTGSEMASHSPLLLFCMRADMSLCRHRLASMEWQDTQYKLRNGSPTLILVSTFEFIHTEWMSGI